MVMENISNLIMGIMQIMEWEEMGKGKGGVMKWEIISKREILVNKISQFFVKLL